MRMVDGAAGVSANRACTSCAFAVDNNCSLGRFAGSHGISAFGVILGTGNFGVLVTRKRTGLPLLRVAMCRLDLY